MVEKIDDSLEFLLDSTKSKYDLVRMASLWYKVLISKDEGRKTPPAELIKQAIDDVTHDRVTMEEIEKEFAKIKVVAKTLDEKAAEKLGEYQGKNK